MKNIPATPFARLNLKDQQSYLVSVEPTDWPEHLLRAYEIANERAPEVAKRIVIDALVSAHRFASKARESQLREERSAILTAFCKASKRLSNATKRGRLPKTVRTRIDEATRTIFASGFVDLSAVQRFLCECDVMPERNLALDYEATPAHCRLECESALARLVSENPQSITAHEVFATLHDASLRCTAMINAQRDQNLLQEYLAELDRIWTRYGIRVGRGNHHADSNYRSPFLEFAERVLLNQRKPGSNLFEPVSELESQTVRKRYYELPLEWQRATSARPFRDSALITDRVLRGYLDRRTVSKKSS